jgi:hypothetical protein
MAFSKKHVKRDAIIVEPYRVNLSKNVISIVKTMKTAKTGSKTNDGL